MGRTQASRAWASLQALGIGLPVVGMIAFALSFWIYTMPRFEDLGVLQGTVAHVEIVRPTRSSPFGRVTLIGGEVLHVRKMHAMEGAAASLRALRVGTAVTAWIDPRELERPHHHLAWQLYGEHEPIVDFRDLLESFRAERARFRTFCLVVFIGGLMCFAVGFALPRRNT